MIKPARVLCVVLLVAITLGGLPSPARASGPVDVQAVDAYLRGQVAANHIPGLAVVVVQDGRVVFQQGYGQEAPGKPLTAQSQFYLGSVTKSFTALAVMQLVELGRLELDAPVQRYLPWFRVADPQASAAITVRHLLNQTSGLSPAGDPGAGDYAPTLEAEVLSLAQASLTAPVGTKFQYYNQNYRTLGLLIEQASGQRYGDYLRDHVLVPLSMAHTVTYPADAPALAQGHGQVFGLALPRPQPFRPAALPSGYLISTAEDMGHYLVALLDEGRYGAGQLVQPTTLAQLFTAPAGAESDYGMGWLVTGTTDGERVLFHDGAVESYSSAVMLLPERGIGFALLLSQYGMIQQVAVNTPLTVGLANVLVGDAPPAPSLLARLPLALLVLAVLDLLNHLRCFWQLPRWAARVSRRPRGAQWLWPVLQVALSLAVLAGLPALLGAVRGEATSWPEMFNVLPDVAGWVLVGFGLNLVRGLARLAIVARRPFFVKG